MNDAPARPAGLSPREIEQRFTNLLSSFVHVRDDETKLRGMAGFVEELDRVPADLAYSYLLQLSGPFFFLASQAVLSPCPPDEISRLLDAGRILKDRLPGQIDEAAEHAARANLVLHLATVHFYLGELAEGYRVLAESFAHDGGEREPGREGEAGGKIGIEAGAANSADDAPNLERFRRFAREIQAPPALETKLGQILEQWEKATAGAVPDRIPAVLVETETPFARDSRGTVATLEVSARPSPDPQGADLVAFNNTSPAVERELLHVASDAAAAAAESFAGRTEHTGRALSYTFSFPEKGFFYSGESLGTALALLAYNQKLVQAKRRSHLAFRRDAAVTGDIDLRGNIRRVDADGLAAKIRAVFFSPYRCLFLPRENLMAARSRLHELNARHPARRLDLAGAETLGELLRDSRLVERVKIPWRRYISQRTSRAVRLVLGVAALALLFTAAVIVSRDPRLHFWKDRVPARFEVFNDWIVVSNLENRLLWKYRAPRTLLPAYSKGIFSDVDDDGKKELLFVATPSVEDLASSRLICFSQGGAVKWDYTVGGPIRTADRTYDEIFIASPPFVFRPRQGETPLILVGANQSPWEPYQLSLLDSTGRRVGEFWNAGHFDHNCYKFEDLDGDGTVEILAGGQNNGFDRACLAVFDPRRIAGASPQEGAADCRYVGLGEGTPKFYVLFPRSILTEKLSVRNCVRSIEIRRQERKIVVVVVEAGRDDYQCLRYVFNYRFEILDVLPEDSFRAKINELKAFGVIPKDFSAKDIAAYKNQVDYWDGERWTRAPAENGRWRE